ncbi:MAG: hypothetical protein JNL08_05860 [Planctomycetes bacterium]|nr:hypothetical protein [Planctomycetota bacterium]
MNDSYDPPFEQRFFGDVSRRRVCAIVSFETREAGPVVGTGTAVRHRGELFVATCAHVAKSLFAGFYGALNFDRLPEVSHEECIEVFRNDALDLALLRVRPRAAGLLHGIHPLEVSDIGTVVDFERAMPDTKRVYCIAGLPGALAQVDNDAKRITLLPFVFPTVVVRNDRDDHIDFEYEHGLVDGDLLCPEGMSGGLIFEFMAPGDDELWRPGVAVAVQHAWDPFIERLYCSPAYHLRDALLRM